MFDFGISELAVVAVVALVVIGPERLPKVARTVGTLRARSFASGRQGQSAARWNWTSCASSDADAGRRASIRRCVHGRRRSAISRHSMESS
jgi:sec-independent protein translocase protein TatB